MKIYNYTDTGEYIFESEAKISPLDGVPLVPRNATVLPPPLGSDSHVAVFNGSLWELVEDHRGETWYKKGTREPVVIDFFGNIDSNLYQNEPEPLSEQEKWDEIRTKRNSLLGGSDWTQTLDSPVDRVAWAQYRQALRDIPQIFPTPEEVVWPTKPGA